MYFQPLTLFGFLALLTVFFVWDVVGYTLFNKSSQQWLFCRPLAWLIGMGIWTLLLFLLHFSLPFTSIWLSITLIILVLIFGPKYIHSGGLISWWRWFKTNGLVFVLLVPFLPILWVKTSLPPYAWDEMTYHYISPYTLNQEKAWNFGTGLYANIPKEIETAGIGLFALFKTYAPSRIVNSAIFLTWILFFFAYIRLYLKPSYAFLLTAVLVILGRHLFAESTLGYVDVQAASLISIALVLGLYALFNSQIRLLKLALAMWALALGTKYNSLLPFGIFTLYAAWYINLWKKSIWHMVLLVLGLGGYWYIKNWLVFGSPFYPFWLFGCPDINCQNFMSSFKVAWSGTGESFGSVWANIQKYLPTWFGWPVFLLGIIVGLRLWIARAYLQTKMLIILALLLAADVLISSRMFVFIPRYYYHWLFISISILAMGMSIMNIDRIYYLLRVLVVSALTYLLFITWQQWQVPEFKVQTNFAMKRISVDDWIAYILPRSRLVVDWCNQGSGLKKLVRLDPDLIWYNYEGRSPIYFVNCTFSDDSIRPAYVWSLSPCRAEVVKGHALEDDLAYSLRLTNNRLVCQGDELLPTLYVVD